MTKPPEPLFLRLIDKNIVIQCPSQDWRELVTQMWRPFIHADGEIHGTHIEIQTNESGAWAINAQGIRDISGDDPWMLLLTLRTVLGHLALEGNDEMLQLHAVAVQKGSTVILLPGRSGSGKTTLGLELLRRGYSLIGDDLIPIRHDDLGVLPFPHPIGLAEGNATSSNGIWRAPDWMPAPSRVVMVPASSFEIASGGKPEAIAFPNYSATSPGSIERLSVAEALLQCGAQVKPLGQTTMGTLARICDRVRIASLIFPDAARGAELLEGFIATEV